MSRSIWKGDISFGLVTIPVSIHPAEERNELTFHLLDGRDMAPIRQQRVNSVTGEIVPWEETVKGYEYEPDRFVVITDDDFRAADVEATRTVDVLAMVRAEEISTLFYDRPYFLAPASKAARKPYAILRDTLARTGYVGVASVVIRTRQHLAAILPVGDALVLDMLRFPSDLRSADELELPGSDPAELGVTDAEMDLASQLVEAMTGPWDPSAYHDTYREALTALIEHKVETGEVLAPPIPEERPAAGEVVDIMSLLKRSLDERRAAGGA
ncbi:MAG: Ku protein [Actinobacteria bacterium HGW-Actinobacteria-6]|jgi:DNA end-binding protein Ku|nr:MAG: Ku protein [Actinobacteria bacterium HGW-Actinobacteria-6]